MKLLLTGAFQWTNEKIETLKNLGYEVLYVDREDTILANKEKSVDAVVCNWLFVHHNIKEFKNLKYIQLLSAGTDRIPIEYITEHDIVTWNARGVYSIPMAEFVIGGVLQLLKGSKQFYRNQMKALWEKNRGLIELNGMNILIIGTGSVGTEIAKRFQAFTDCVRGVDVSPRKIPYFQDVVNLDNLDNELRIADVVIVTLPLTTNTYHMFDSKLFEKMKFNSIFVNVSRGGLVDENALSKALDNKLYGAVLDVFEKEPLPESSDLWNRENVIISPHNSFVSNGNNNRMWNVIYSNLKEAIK